MKKFFSKFLPLFTMALCVLCFLPACSDDEDEDGPIVGTWVETFVEYEETTITTFVFRADGTGMMSVRVEADGSGISGDPQNFDYTYNAEKGEIRLKFEGNGTLYSGTADITGNTLVLRIADTYYNLKKQ